MKVRRVEKKPIDPTRLRHIPSSGFSWIDRRFVRAEFLEELPAEAILLYLFLVAVSDAEGLSFYSDPTLSRLLKIDAQELSQSRSRLVDRALILYRYPLYQVLSLPPVRARPPALAPAAAPRRGGEPMSIREFFAEAVREAAQGSRGSA